MRWLLVHERVVVEGSAAVGRGGAAGAQDRAGGSGRGGPDGAQRGAYGTARIRAWPCSNTVGYEAVPGKLPALHRRFETITLGYFKKHGIGGRRLLGRRDGHQQRAALLLRYDDMAHREKAWGAFQADEGWIRDRAETESDGPLVARVYNQFWRANRG